MEGWRGGGCCHTAVPVAEPELANKRAAIHNVYQVFLNFSKKKRRCKTWSQIERKRGLVKAEHTECIKGRVCKCVSDDWASWRVELYYSNYYANHNRINQSHVFDLCIIRLFAVTS